MSQISVDNSIDFYIFICCEKAPKNLVVKIQNVILNHESQPIKSNPDKFQGLSIRQKPSRQSLTFA